MTELALTLMSITILLIILNDYLKYREFNKYKEHMNKRIEEIYNAFIKKE